MSLLVAVAACGRIGFGARATSGDGGGGDDGGAGNGGDALDGAPDAPRQLPVLIQSAGKRAANTAGLTVPVVATGSGHLIVVGTGNYAPPQLVTSVHDDAGNVYVSANVLSTWASASNDTVEIWYAANSLAGATAVTVDSAGMSTRDVWVVEVKGIELVSPLDDTGAISNPPATVTPAAPAVTPTVTPAFVFSVGDFQNSTSGIQPGNPFLGLAVLDGNNAAYTIAAAPGSYGAVWMDPSLSSYCSSTVSFRAAP